ncbi:hypothetical protein FBU30_002690 [Linnemannia zychae]|nr:hypothetical protein FBU30_002690 [Linnemannia zychae]
MRLSLTIAGLLFISHYPAPNYAQTPPTPYNPTSLFSAHSAFVEGKALYVHGGIADSTNSTIGTGQTFALDLSTFWTTVQPTFKKLRGGFPYPGSTSAMLSDKRGWVLFSGNQTVVFDTQLETWGAPKIVAQMNLDASGFLPAVTDPSTNQVYVVNGFLEPIMVATGDTIAQAASEMPPIGPVPFPTSTTKPQALPPLTSPAMLRYNGITGKIDSLGSGTGFEVVEEGFASCWSSHRKSLFLHGGTIGSPALYQNTLYEFSPSASKYTALTITGTMPSARKGHCIVEAYGGTKMVLFGGVDETSAVLDDIYILDVASLTWKAGKVGGYGVGRSYAACAVTNDLFVAWGGALRIGNKFIALGTSFTMVYNLKTGVWQSTFSPGQASTTSASIVPTGQQTNDTSSSSTNGALIGGIVGGLVLIAAIAGFVFFHHRRASKQEKLEKKEFPSPTFTQPAVVTKTDTSSNDYSSNDIKNKGKEEKSNEGDDKVVPYASEVLISSKSSTLHPNQTYQQHKQEGQSTIGSDSAVSSPSMSDSNVYRIPIVHLPSYSSESSVKIFTPMTIDSTHTKPIVSTFTPSSSTPIIPFRLQTIIPDATTAIGISSSYTSTDQQNSKDEYISPVIYNPGLPLSDRSSMATVASSEMVSQAGSPNPMRVSTLSAATATAQSFSPELDIAYQSYPYQEARASVQFVPVVGGNEDREKEEAMRIAASPGNPQGTGIY